MGKVIAFPSGKKTEDSIFGALTVHIEFPVKTANDEPAEMVSLEFESGAMDGIEFDDAVAHIQMLRDLNPELEFTGEFIALI